MVKSNDNLIKRVHLFSNNLPNLKKLIVFLTFYSIIIGLIISTITELKNIEFFPVIVIGILTGLIIIFLPTILTTITIKIIKKYIKTKYILAIAIASTFIYSIFLILASLLYYITNNYILASSIVLVGDASMLALWLFVSKVMLGQKKKALLYSIIQPIINLFVYIGASNIIFTFSLPVWLLLIKLSTGIIIFALVSYIIIYIIDKPIKKNLNFSGIDAFSEIVQNWLFDINIKISNQKGYKSDIYTHTIIIKNEENKIKALFYIPEIHYGPVGTIGGSHFPYLLQTYASKKYNTNVFIMHPTVNEDNNPLSSSEINILKNNLNKSIKEVKKVDYRSIEYYKGVYETTRVSLLKINNLNIAAFTRAPKVTEDFSQDAEKIIRELLVSKGSDLIMLDLHNSRYESASKIELDGIKADTKYIYEYIRAIKELKKVAYAQKLYFGSSSIDIYDIVGRPIDIAPGPLNCTFIKIGNMKQILLVFNSNNMLPSFRNNIIKYVENKYKISTEVCTTDTHFVNSLQRTASNVLGRNININLLLPLIDKAVEKAIKDAEIVNIYYKKSIIKNFNVWGPDIKKNVMNIVTYVFGLAKILIPIILVSSFIIAAWIISLI
jgi:predicted neutral ceramidase superfamily lipid hydrolase